MCLFGTGLGQLNVCVAKSDINHWGMGLIGSVRCHVAETFAMPHEHELCYCHGPTITATRKAHILSTTSERLTHEHRRLS